MRLELGPPGTLGSEAGVPNLHSPSNATDVAPMSGHRSQLSMMLYSFTASLRAAVSVGWSSVAAGLLAGCALHSMAAASQVTTTATSAGSASNAPRRSALSIMSNIPRLYTEGSLGPVERNQSVGRGAQGDGSTLTIQGQTFQFGFGTRAPSVIAFDLGGRGVRFTASVGMDDTCLLYTSPSPRDRG